MLAGLKQINNHGGNKLGLLKNKLSISYSIDPKRPLLVTACTSLLLSFFLLFTFIV